MVKTSIGNGQKSIISKKNLDENWKALDSLFTWQLMEVHFCFKNRLSGE